MNIRAAPFIAYFFRDLYLYNLDNIFLTKLPHVYQMFYSTQHYCSIYKYKHSEIIRFNFIFNPPVCVSIYKLFCLFRAILYYRIVYYISHIYADGSALGYTHFFYSTKIIVGDSDYRFNKSLSFVEKHRFFFCIMCYGDDI